MRTGTNERGRLDAAVCTRGHLDAKTILISLIMTNFEYKMLYSRVVIIRTQANPKDAVIRKGLRISLSLFM